MTSLAPYLHVSLVLWGHYHGQGGKLAIVICELKYKKIVRIEPSTSLLHIINPSYFGTLLHYLPHYNTNLYLLLFGTPFSHVLLLAMNSSPKKRETGPDVGWYSNTSNCESINPINQCKIRDRKVVCNANPAYCNSTQPMKFSCTLRYQRGVVNGGDYKLQLGLDDPATLQTLDNCQNNYSEQEFFWCILGNNYS